MTASIKKIANLYADSILEAMKGTMSDHAETVYNMAIEDHMEIGDSKRIENIVADYESEAMDMAIDRAFEKLKSEGWFNA